MNTNNEQLIEMINNKINTNYNINIGINNIDHMI
jgi:hypothetical protein